MLDKVQNQAMRLTTGAMKSTPIKVMEDTTAISSLGHRRDMRNSHTSGEIQMFSKSSNEGANK